MNDATGARPAGPVRVSVTQIDLTQGALRQGELLLDVEEADAATATERVSAWAQTRGYTKLRHAVEEVLATAPETGFAAIINKPHSLMSLATWPWAPTDKRHDHTR